MDTQSCSMSVIRESFSLLKKEGRIALMPFLMAGDPDLTTTAEILLELQENGADIIELGIPYSDPLADGPVIQAAAARALKVGTTPASVLEMLCGLKGKLSIPVIVFTYSNPIHNTDSYDVSNFEENIFGGSHKRNLGLRRTGSLLLIR